MSSKDIKTSTIQTIKILPFLLLLLGAVFFVLGAAAGLGLVGVEVIARWFGIKIKYTFDAGIFTTFLAALAGYAAWKLQNKDKT